MPKYLIKAIHNWRPSKFHFYKIYSFVSDVIEFLFLSKSSDQEDDISVDTDTDEKNGDTNKDDDQVEIFMWQVWR